MEDSKYFDQFDELSIGLNDLNSWIWSISYRRSSPNQYIILVGMDFLMMAQKELNDYFLSLKWGEDADHSFIYSCQALSIVTAGEPIIILEYYCGGKDRVKYMPKIYEGEHGTVILGLGTFIAYLIEGKYGEGPSKPLKP